MFESVNSDTKTNLGRYIVNIFKSIKIGQKDKTYFFMIIIN